jgi:hypothetical protein
MRLGGDADPRHKAVDPRGELRGGDGFVGTHRGDRQFAVFKRHAFDLAGPEPVRKFLQQPVEFTAPVGKPFVGGGWQLEAGCDRRDLSRRKQVAVEASVIRRSLDPDVARAALSRQPTVGELSCIGRLWLTYNAA